MSRHTGGSLDVMGGIEKFIGNFAYQADTVPKRFRHPQLVDLHGKTEYAVPRADPSEVKFDAVMAVEHAAGDKPHQVIGFAGWNGRLWRPAADGAVTRFEDYKARFQGAWPKAEKGDFLQHLPPGCHNDPYLTSIEFDYAVRGQSSGLDTPMGTYDEAGFEGTITHTNRGDALRRKEAAARHVLVVGDEVYFAYPEPVWGCHMMKMRDLTSVTIDLTCPVPYADWRRYHHRRATNGQFVSEGKCFRLDRLEDAKAWVRATYGDVSVTVRGRVEAMDASFLAQDDVALTLRDMLPAVVSYGGQLGLYLSEAGATALNAVAAAARSITMYDNGLIDRYSPRLIEAVRVLQRDCTSRLFPPSERYSAKMTASIAADLLGRLDFELQLRSGLGIEDETALAAFALQAG